MNYKVEYEKWISDDYFDIDTKIELLNIKKRIKRKLKIDFIKA